MSSMFGRQLLKEQLPRRVAQLYKVYGPEGVIPLIPEAQILEPELQIVNVELSPDNLAEQYIQIFNPNQFAVDISSWQLMGSIRFIFAAAESISGHQIRLSVYK